MDLQQIKQLGYRHSTDNEKVCMDIENALGKQEVLKDGAFYKGNDGVHLRCYFVINGVYTVATNGLGVNSKTGGMFNVNYYNRNTAGYATILNHCKNEWATPFSTRMMRY